jgi:hypothetical protein
MKKEDPLMTDNTSIRKIQKATPNKLLKKEEDYQMKPVMKKRSI